MRSLRSAHVLTRANALPQALSARILRVRGRKAFYLVQVVGRTEGAI